MHLYRLVLRAANSSAAAIPATLLWLFVMPPVYGNQPEPGLFVRLVQGISLSVFTVPAAFLGALVLGLPARLLLTKIGRNSVPAYVLIGITFGALIGLEMSGGAVWYGLSLPVLVAAFVSWRFGCLSSNDQMLRK